MDKDFFVMLNTQSGGCALMFIEANGFEEPAMFATGDEAIADAEKNILGSTFGFEVFRRGNGELEG